MRLTMTTLLLFIAASALAQSEIDRSVAAIAGREAQFTQQFTPKGFKKSQNESGTVVFGTLPMMRWTYSKPEAKVFVFDGRRSWFYVPADRQVTTSAIDDRKKRELPFLLIGDPAARVRYFNASEKRRGSAVVTTLQPRDAGAMIRNIVLTSDASSHYITSVEYSDRNGNRTAFYLTGYRPMTVSPGTFQFAPPAGVEVTQAQ
jgi:chaperone LolA